MIGYMKPLKQMLNSDDKRIYQALYCGLCRNLRFDYGVKGTLLINYEIINILLLLKAIQPDTPAPAKMSCSLSPFLWRKMIGYDDIHFRFGGAVSIIVAALELQDNVVDDDRIRDRIYLAGMRSAIKKVQLNYPDVWKSLKQCYEDCMLSEKNSKENNDGFFDNLNSCGKFAQKIGEIMGGLLSEKLADDIGKMMFYWGEWIYLVDAIDDLEKDRKLRRFNPLFLSDCPADTEGLLVSIEKNANTVVFSLPILRYEHIIRELFGRHFLERRDLVCRMSKYKHEG